MLIADTGFFLALANKKDRWHPIAKKKLQQLDERLITTWPVMTETCHLLTRELGISAQTRFIDNFRKGVFIAFSLNDSLFPRLIKLIQSYSDLPMDLADASLVLLAEHLGDGRILSTDQRDFRTYKWKNNKPFRNLLLE